MLTAAIIVFCALAGLFALALCSAAARADERMIIAARLHAQLNLSAPSSPSSSPVPHGHVYHGGAESPVACRDRGTILANNKT